MRCDHRVGHDFTQTDLESRPSIKDRAPLQATFCMTNIGANVHPRLNNEIRSANYISFEDYLFDGLMQCRLSCVQTIRCG
ncbi:hypothetical protein BG58_27755 [Caballeronia jiangsuensis]|nr:hypothetical protein BG58_27755 [Caballeronia jiangsuensis]